MKHIKIFLYVAPIIGILVGVGYLYLQQEREIDLDNKVVFTERDFQKAVLNIFDDNIQYDSVELRKQIGEEFDSWLPFRIIDIYIYHLVIKGENLNSIAKRYNITVVKLVEWNPELIEKNEIKENSLIKIYIPLSQIEKND